MLSADTLFLRDIMTNVITYDKLERYAYDNIYELINTRSNIPDPRNRPSSQKLIYKYDPLDSVNAQIVNIGFPHVVLSPVQGLVPSQESTRGSTKRYAWTQAILVRSLRFGASGSNPETGMNDLNDLSDSFTEYFNSAAGKNELSDLKIKNVKLTKVSSTPNMYDAIEYYETEFQLTYNARLNTWT